MSFKDTNFTDRLSAANEAKRALLSKFEARPSADDPAVAERRAARLVVSRAREERAAERKVAKAAKEASEAAETVQREAEEQTRREAVVAQKVREKAALEEKQKAARDLRYLMRKARK